METDSPDPDARAPAPARAAPSAVPLHRSPPPLRWLHLDLNSYFASVEQQMNPAWRGRPLIVAPVESDSTCAIAASIEAKRLGIKTGTPVWEARQRCPGLIVAHARHEHYVAYHHAIIAEVERHVPVHSVESVDEVAIRLADNENGRDQVAALVARIKHGIRSRVGDQLRCSVGVAPSRLLAKLGSDVQKPDGLVIFEAGDLPGALHQFRLADICGIGRNMERRLLRRGIGSIAQFCALGPRRARALWGSIEGERVWYLLHGVDLDKPATHTRSIGHSHVLAPEARGAAAARATARRLAAKAAARLRRKGYRAGEVLLHVRPTDQQGKWKGALAIAPAQDDQAILGAIDRLWLRMEAGLRAAGRPLHFRQVGLMLLGLSPADNPQYGLFEEGGGTAGSQPATSAQTPRALALSQALDQVNARFGRQTVKIGAWCPGLADVIGTKIAFNRIPERIDLPG